MSYYTTEQIQSELPVIATKGLVAFPGEMLNFEIKRDDYRSDVAAKESFEGTGYVVIVSETEITSPGEDLLGIDSRLYSIGTVAKIRQLIKISNGGMRIVAEGLSRAKINSYNTNGLHFNADVTITNITINSESNSKNQAFVRVINDTLFELLHFLPSFSPDILDSARSIKRADVLSDFIAANVFVNHDQKIDILGTLEPFKRAAKILTFLHSELDVLRCEAEIQDKTKSYINKSQREYYLREEMKAIQEELGVADSDTNSYIEKIQALNLSEEATEKLTKEAERLSKIPFGSIEIALTQNYLDTCISLPWNKSAKYRSDVKAARKILNEDHEGLEKIKERLLEFIAVKQLSPDLKSQIICLVGPPGVGKTSIAASLARAMKTKYVRVSLGGIRDEADIRGHRKTYVGAMPGRIIDAIQRVGINNPLILLDEIDKMTSDSRGDPASALLEVLDPEQNKNFRDHFIEIPFDLSGCTFIATANSLDTVPKPLIDRMEVIELHTYTKSEKMSIAKNHLIPKQLKRHGLNKRKCNISDGAIEEIIDCYTRESGVRNLERNIASLCRKAALEMIDTNVSKVSIEADNISKYLGVRAILPELISKENEIGEVNGLAYTQAGGDLLKIEAAVMDGTGKLELTGNLGDVMKESAHASLTCVRQLAHKYGIPSDFYSKKDIHIHVPEGAVPKDGPSAGVTMTTAIVSALASIPVKNDVAMTGEITLRGKVLAIGGLREKTMAAYTAGVKTVLIPADNQKDLEEIDPMVRKSLNFIPCKKIDDVLDAALSFPQKSGRTNILAVNTKIESSEIIHPIPELQISSTV